MCGRAFPNKTPDISNSLLTPQAAKQSLQAAAAQNARPRPPDCPMPAYPPPPPPLAPEKSALEEGEIEEGEIA